MNTTSEQTPHFSHTTIKQVVTIFLNNMSTLEELNEEITDLKAENRDLKEERKHAATDERKDKFLDLINTNTERLLEMERRQERQQQQQFGKLMYCNHYILSI